MFKRPENRITVHVPYIGGGFGSKNNVKTEAVSVMLSLMTGKPVRLCLTMEEGFLTNTQHAAILRLKTGVMAETQAITQAPLLVRPLCEQLDGTAAQFRRDGVNAYFRIAQQRVDQRDANCAKSGFGERRTDLEQYRVSGCQNTLFALRQALQLQGLGVKRVAWRD